MYLYGTYIVFNMIPHHLILKIYSLVKYMTYKCRSRCHKNSSCAIFVLKLIFWLKSIFLGVKLLKTYGVQFFRALDLILGAIYEEHAFLCLFGTLNISKAIIPDKKLFLHCILQFRSRLKVL